MWDGPKSLQNFFLKCSRNQRLRIPFILTLRVVHHMKQNPPNYNILKLGSSKEKKEMEEAERTMSLQRVLLTNMRPNLPIGTALNFMSGPRPQIAGIWLSYSSSSESTVHRKEQILRSSSNSSGFQLTLGCSLRGCYLSGFCFIFSFSKSSTRIDALIH